MSTLKEVAEATPEEMFLELPFGEQMLLWGIRVWVRSYRNDSNVQNLLHIAYSRAGVPSAHTGLDTMMEMIIANGYGVMEVRCPSCTSISADEMRLMAAIAAWQHGTSSHDGDIYLKCWAKPATLRILRPAAQLLAKALKDGGLLIRPRPWSLTPLTSSKPNIDAHMQSVAIH